MFCFVTVNILVLFLSQGQIWPWPLKTFPIVKFCQASSSGSCEFSIYSISYHCKFLQSCFGCFQRTLSRELSEIQETWDQSIFSVWGLVDQSDRSQPRQKSLISNFCNAELSSCWVSAVSRVANKKRWLSKLGNVTRTHMTHDTWHMWLGHTWVQLALLSRRSHRSSEVG